MTALQRTGSTRWIHPLYTHWSLAGPITERLANVRKGDLVVVVGEYSGAGVERVDGLAQLVARCKLLVGSKGAVLGYVPLGYGQRTYGEVAINVSDWFNWYGITSIFRDEDAEACSGITTGAWPLVRNFGRVPVDEAPTPQTVVFEGTATDFLAASTLPKSCTVLVHSCPPELAAEVQVKARVLTCWALGLTSSTDWTTA